MGVFEMVVAIVAITAVASLIRTAVKSRSAGGLSAHQEARLAKLEERVQALESVVGDSSYELKQKFHELEK
jgi:peptidoglycan hydrolase CwlO-like protein